MWPSTTPPADIQNIIYFSDFNVNTSLDVLFCFLWKGCFSNLVFSVTPWWQVSAETLAHPAWVSLLLYKGDGMHAVKGLIAIIDRGGIGDLVTRTQPARRCIVSVSAGTVICQPKLCPLACLPNGRPMESFTEFRNSTQSENRSPSELATLRAAWHSKAN